MDKIDTFYHSGVFERKLYRARCAGCGRTENFESDTLRPMPDGWRKAIRLTPVEYNMKTIEAIFCLQCHENGRDQDWLDSFEF